MNRKPWIEIYWHLNARSLSKPSKKKIGIPWCEVLQGVPCFKVQSNTFNWGGGGGGGGGGGMGSTVAEMVNALFMLFFVCLLFVVICLCSSGVMKNLMTRW